MAVGAATTATAGQNMFESIHESLRHSCVVLIDVKFVDKVSNNPALGHPGAKGQGDRRRRTGGEMVSSG